MTLWERVIENRIRAETLVSNNQFGFMPKIDLGSYLFIKKIDGEI